jgi:hypothetical protein
MAYGNHLTIGQFFISLARGFRETRLEILLFFLIIIALLVLFTLYTVVQKRRARLELARHSREILEHLLWKLDLNAQEKDLLGGLARHLSRGESVHSLLVNVHVFDACARKMRQSESVDETQLGALRLKIDFRVLQPEEAPTSSAELPEGSPVLLVAGPGTRLRGTLVAQGPGSLLVQLGKGISPPAMKTGLTMYFHNAAGIFSFHTRVTDQTEDGVRLAHSTQITRHQRRKFYRSKVRLPVFVTSSSVAAVPQESLLLDLGGGGASLQNPGGQLKKGSPIKLSFSSEIGKFTLSCRVLRVSRNGRIINVKFESLQDAERNRIMGFLFKQSEGRRSPSP